MDDRTLTAEQVYIVGRDGTGVRKASATSIQIEFQYNGVSCRERIKLPPTPTNLKHVTRLKEKIEYEITSGTFNYAEVFPNSKHLPTNQAPTDILVGTWLDLWLDNREPYIKSSTYNGYRKIIIQLRNAFGDKKLCELNDVVINNWCKNKKASNLTIKHILSPLRSALDYAVKEKILQVNPLTGFNFKRIEPPAQDKELDPFTIEEESAIYSACSGHALNLFQFFFWTGMRTSEVVALIWSDVDFTNNTIRIVRAKTQAAKNTETTKTVSGTRTIKLLEPARQALLNQKSLSDSKGEIFLNPYNNLPWGGDMDIRRLWIKILIDGQVRYRRPYQTRHTFASRMLSAGESLRWLSHHLGHSSVTITERVYAKYITGSHPDAGNLGVELFKSVY